MIPRSGRPSKKIDRPTAVIRIVFIFEINIKYKINSTQLTNSLFDVGFVQFLFGFYDRI